MNKIKICSTNTKGLGDPAKRRDVLDYLRNQNYSIICLQEVFDESSWEILNDTLRPLYPYILYDPFKMFLRWNHFCVINSGLYIASKYPIIRSEFFTFSDAYFEDAACSRGLLIAEIDIQNNKSIIVGKC